MKLLRDLKKLSKIAVCCSCNPEFKKLIVRSTTSWTKAYCILWYLNREKQLSNWLQMCPININGCIVYNYTFSRLMLMNSQFCRVDKLCDNRLSFWTISVSISAATTELSDGWTDRQRTFCLYIVNAWMAIDMNFKN